MIEDYIITKNGKYRLDFSKLDFHSRTLTQKEVARKYLGSVDKKARNRVNQFAYNYKLFKDNKRIKIELLHKSHELCIELWDENCRLYWELREYYTSDNALANEMARLCGDNPLSHYTLIRDTLFLLPDNILEVSYANHRRIRFYLTAKRILNDKRTG